MKISTTTRCSHVYLHVDRRFHIRGEGSGLIPVWRCSLKKRDFAGVCKELGKLGIESSCHPDECPLASKHIAWNECPFYKPKN